MDESHCESELPLVYCDSPQYLLVAGSESSQIDLCTKKKVILGLGKNSLCKVEVFSRGSVIKVVSAEDQHRVQWNIDPPGTKGACKSPGHTLRPVHTLVRTLSCACLVLFKTEVVQALQEEGDMGHFCPAQRCRCLRLPQLQCVSDTPSNLDEREGLFPLPTVNKPP